MLTPLREDFVQRCIRIEACRQTIANELKHNEDLPVRAFVTTDSLFLTYKHFCWRVEIFN